MGHQLGEGHVPHAQPGCRPIGSSVKASRRWVGACPGPPQAPHTGTVRSPGEAQHRAVQVPGTRPHQKGAFTNQGLGLLSGLLGLRGYKL